MSIYISLLPVFIAVFIAVAYSNAQQKALKAALAAHGYTLMRAKATRRRFIYQPLDTPQPSIWKRPNTAFYEVTFTNATGAITQCLGVVQIKQLGKDATTFFDIDLATLQPR